MTRLARAGALLLAIALLGVAGCTPATPAVQLASTALTMADSGTVSPTLTCTGTAAGSCWRPSAARPSPARPR